MYSYASTSNLVKDLDGKLYKLSELILGNKVEVTNTTGYEYSAIGCLVKDVDGKIYNIIDLYLGNKVEVQNTPATNTFMTRNGLIKDIDGQTINTIQVFESRGGGTSGTDPEPGIIIDGDEEIKVSGIKPHDETLIRFDIENIEGIMCGHNNKYITTPFDYLYIHGLPGGSSTVSVECITNHSTTDKRVNVIIKKDRLSTLDVAGFIEWVQVNNIKIIPV